MPNPDSDGFKKAVKEALAETLHEERDLFRDIFAEVLEDLLLTRIMRFRIELEGSEPVIWREIDVPSMYSFWDLHVAIQDAMGWTDSHLHAFNVEDPETGQVVEIGFPNEEMFEDEVPVIPGWDAPVVSYFSSPGQSASYLYDFGDDWTHRVLLKEIVRQEKGVDFPRCVGGERACPPEDCGGIHGYKLFLDVINDPTHEEHEEMLIWAGGKFDPEHFDPEAVLFDDPEMRWLRAFGGDVNLDETE